MISSSLCDTATVSDSPPRNLSSEREIARSKVLLMATIEEFESMLKEVVSTKRLSASKMEKLTEISMKLMENDTQLVSILYRTHKSLRASSKISSLYVFDAICRAARSQVVKRNLTGDVNSEKGNCATFLQKVDSVLDGLFQDILSSGIPEAKEKTRKIIDIWTKSNTFPANVLTRLGSVDKVADTSESVSKETKQAAIDTSTSTSDPRKQPTPPKLVTPPPASATTPTAEAAQAALLALLSTAAVTNNRSNPSQIPANNVHIQPGVLPSQPQPQEQLGQLQIALLQQLSKASNVGSLPGATALPLQSPAISYSAPIPINSSPFPVQPIAPVTPNLPGPSSAPSATDLPYTYPGQGNRDPRPRPEPSNNGRNEGYSDDGYHNGNSRGYRGGFRGRGRGDFRGTNERNRDAPMRDRENGTYHEGRPAMHRRRFDSRSRSPPRRRDYRSSYSPPHQVSLNSPVERTRGLARGTFKTGKDEFGRDIRDGSEESEGDREGKEGSATSARESIPPTGSSTEATTRDGHSSDVSMDDFHTSKAQNQGAKGLESFDISTFNPMNVDSWRELGEAFEVTNGYVPSQEELMQLVMLPLGMMMSMSMGAGMDANMGLDDANTAIGMDPSNENFGHASRKTSFGEDLPGKFLSDRKSMDATSGQIGADASSGKGMTAAKTADSLHANVETAGGQGGRMQRIGDGWKFVREGP